MTNLFLVFFALSFINGNICAAVWGPTKKAFIMIFLIQTVLMVAYFTLKGDI